MGIIRESSKFFFGCNRIRDIYYTMTHNNKNYAALPVHVYNDVLPADRFNQFLDESNNSLLTFHQSYPGRLMSDRQHSDWLRQYFGNFIGQVSQELGLSGCVQNIFIGMELPNAWFRLHRNHPDVAAVAIWNLDNQSVQALTMLSSDAQFDEDYPLPSQVMGEPQTRWPLHRNNQALVINNTLQRPYWGFDSPVPAGGIKRSVWIYFGR